MNEALHSIRSTTLASRAARPSRAAQRERRGQGAPFILGEDPPAGPRDQRVDEAEPTGERARLDVGHQLEDEQGKTIDVTA